MLQFWLFLYCYIMTITLPIVKSMWRPCRADPFYSHVCYHDVMMLCLTWCDVQVPKVTFYEVIKSILFAVLLLPIRLLLVLLLHCLGYLFILLGTAGLSDEKLTQPLGRVRRTLIGVNGVLSRVILFVLGFVWIRTKRIRAQDMPNPALWSDDIKASIQVANHGMYNTSQRHGS